MKSLGFISCAVTVLLAGCSSPAQQLRSAASGCMGDLDNPAIAVDDNGKIAMAIGSFGVTADDAECVLMRLDAPSRALTKVRGLMHENATGYTEWGTFRVEVLPGPYVLFSEAPS